MESKEAIIEVENPWFTFLKTVEGKKANDRWSKIKVGDLINIVNSKKKDDVFQMKVKKLGRYRTIKEYLEKEVLPNVKSITEGKKVYEGYWDSEKDKEELKTYGVLAIHLEFV